MARPGARRKSSAAFGQSELDNLYTLLSADEGVTVEELSGRLQQFAEAHRSAPDIQAYREGRKPWKKLRDEVIPVARYLQAQYPPEVRVRFPLDDQPPDAWLTTSQGVEPVGIEVTGALGRAGVEIGRSLARGGAVAGFIPLQDDAERASFERVRQRGRITHSRAEIDRTIDEALRRRMEQKDKAKFAGQILIVTAPLHSSPNRSAEELRAAHAATALALPFAQVFVIDPTMSNPNVVQLK